MNDGTLLCILLIFAGYLLITDGFKIGALQRRISELEDENARLKGKGE